MPTSKQSNSDGRLANRPDAPFVASSGLDSGNFKHFYQLYWHELCNYLRSRYYDSAIDPEDIAQAAFARLAEVKDGERIRNPHAFLFATARNIAIDEIRKIRIRLAHKQAESESPDSEVVDRFSPENVLIGRQRLGLMNAVIQKLPKMQRRVLLLHRLDRLTYSQIASKCGLSETTVRRRVADAVERIHRGMKRADLEKFKDRT